jgi:hypothetical protein
MSGEYGEKKDRPHFHACLFGTEFEDRKYFRTLPSGAKIYNSAELEKLWPYGYSSVGEVTLESAAYVARYICKKVTGDLAERHYARVDVETGEVVQLTPEFCRMSLKPGIGTAWLEKYGMGDVFPHDRVIVKGQKCTVPKFYKKWLKKVDAFMSDDLDYERVLKAEAGSADTTPERLAVREVVDRARLKFKKRGLG